MSFNLGKFLEDFTDFSSDELSLKMKILRSIGRAGLYLFTKSVSYEELIESLLARQERIAICCDVPFMKRDQVSAVYNDYHCLFVRSSQLGKLAGAFPRHSEAISKCKLVSFWSYFNQRHQKFLTHVKCKFEILNAGLLNNLLPVLDQSDMPVVEVGAEKFPTGYGSGERLGKTLKLGEDITPIDKKDEVRSLLQIFRASKIWETKVEENTEKREKILILGRESGSVLKRFLARWRNNSDQLIRDAVTQYPDAIFYYWQDYDSQKTANYYESYFDRNIHDFVALQSLDEALNLVDYVDHIYTEASSIGFLGVLLNTKVSTYAKMFYTGLGLTEDRYKKKPAKNKVSIEDAFYSCFLKDKTYFHPQSGYSLTFPEMISFLVLEKLSLEDIFEITDSNIDLTTLAAGQVRMSKAFDLAIYLRDTGEVSKAEQEKMGNFIEQASDAQDCMQISSLLIATANYDALAAYCEYLVKSIETEKNEIQKQKFFYAHILDQLSIALKNSNGRVISTLPSILPEVNGHALTSEVTQELVLQLVKCYSFNIQYQELEDLVNIVLKQDNLPIDFSRKFCHALGVRGGRNERDPGAKYRLLFKATLRLKEDLHREFSGYSHDLLTNIVYSMSLENVEDVVAGYRKLAEHLPGNSLLGVVKRPSSLIFLIQRFKDIAAMYEFLLKQREVGLARDFIDRVSFINTQKHTRLWLHYYSYIGDNDRFLQYYDRLNDREKQTVPNLGLYARTLRNTYQFDLAVSALRHQLQLSRSAEKKVVVKAALDLVLFLRTSNEILNSYPQPRHPKGVVFIASQTCYNSLAMLVPSLLQLKKMGYAVINLTEGLVETQPTGIDYLDKYANSLPANLFALENRFEWNIDWTKRVVESNGINFYQGFYERLSTAHRKYHVDLNERLMDRDLRVQIRRSDACLNLCEKIFEEVVLENNFPVTFISGNSHVTPFSIFRDFCRSKDHEKLGFVNANIAYENYFSNLSGKYATTMCVTDMTLHKTIRAPFLARRDQFDSWYSRNKGVELYQDKAELLINVNRNSSQNNDADPELIAYLNQERSKGKKIVCAFGKIPVDLNVPFDGGAGHADMSDWINHTVEVVNSLDDIVLLVKPHPHELRPEIALDLVDRFEDLIVIEKGTNTRVLGHREINVHTLAPYLDLAVLWNGSSSLELTVLGVPVMMCSYFGKYDYPVDLHYPESRDDYEKSLSEMKFERPDSELRERAAFLMCYMGTDEISIPNQYSLRAVTNDKVGSPRWNQERVDRFLKSGDPAMNLAARRIIEKIK